MSSLNIDIVNGILEKFQQNISQYDVLIESGTLGGQTIINLQPHFRTLHTIELSEHYYNYFDKVKQEKNYQNVVNHFGDTAKVLPEILKTLTTRNKVIFWLDGHWSSGNTAKGNKDCPLIEECISIDNLYFASTGVILIDDYRLFGTHYAEDWSEITLESIVKCFVKHKVQHFISDDILVLMIEK
jgi:hypothetical protein